MSNELKMLNMKSTVLKLYPELAHLYNAPTGCSKCGKNRRGRAILDYILKDPDMGSKDEKAMALLLPEHMIKNRRTT